MDRQWKFTPLVFVKKAISSGFTPRVFRKKAVSSGVPPLVPIKKGFLEWGSAAQGKEDKVIYDLHALDYLTRRPKRC